MLGEVTYNLKCTIINMLIISRCTVPIDLEANVVDIFMHEGC